MVSYEAIKKEFSEMKDKTEHLVGVNDVIVTSSHASGIGDLHMLFDKDVFVPTYMNLGAGGWIKFQLKTPMIVTDVAFISSDDTSVWDNIEYEVMYEDGTTDSGSVTAVQGIGARIVLSSGHKLFYLKLNNTGNADVSIGISEMIFYMSYTFVVDLKGGNIDLGAVKIQDANSDTEAKVDTDQALIVGVDDTQGNRINPATEETLKEVVLQEQYGHKIGYDLVYITTPTNSSGDTATITNPENMFDGDQTTYAYLQMPPKTNITIHLKDPRTIEDIVLRVDSNFDYDNIQYVVEYADGTGKQGKFDGITGSTAHIPVNTTKPVAYVVIYNGYTQERDFNVYEFAMFSTTRQKNVYVYDAGGHVINPAIKEIQQDVKNKIDNIYRFTDFTAQGDGNGSYISRLNEMFDNNIGSCGQVYLKSGGYAYMQPKVSTFLSDFVFVLKDPNGTGLPAALQTDVEIHYGDGTIETTKIQQLYGLRLYIPIDDSRPLDRLYFKNNTSNTLSFCIAELYTEKLYSSGAVGIRDVKGNRINPVSDETVVKILDSMTRLKPGDLNITYTNNSNATSIEDIDNAFDGLASTSALLNIGAGDSVSFYLLSPSFLDNIVLMTYPKVGTGMPFKANVVYLDGTSKEEDIEEIGTALYKVRVDRTKRVVLFKIENPTSNNYSYYLYELYMHPMSLPAAEDRVKEYILTNATVNSSGNSSLIFAPNGKVAELLISLGSATGTPDITFHVEVVEEQSGNVIKSYPTSKISSPGNYYLYMSNDLLGEMVRVSWDGTLDSSNYFSGVYVTLLVKR